MTYYSVTLGSVTYYEAYPHVAWSNLYIFREEVLVKPIAQDIATYSTPVLGVQ